VAHLQDCLPPKTASQLRRYVGMLNFYRRFLPHAAAATQAPLHAALSDPRVKGSHSIIWTPDFHRAFKECKEFVTCHSTGEIRYIRAICTRHRHLHFRHGCRAAATYRQRLAAPRLLLQEAEPGPAEIQRLRSRATGCLRGCEAFPSHAGSEPLYHLHRP
jgi:hypothetical protein